MEWYTLCNGLFFSEDILCIILSCQHVINNKVSVSMFIPPIHMMMLSSESDWMNFPLPAEDTPNMTNTWWSPRGMEWSPQEAEKSALTTTFSLLHIVPEILSWNPTRGFKTTTAVVVAFGFDVFDCCYGIKIQVHVRHSVTGKIVDNLCGCFHLHKYHFCRNR